MMKSRFEVMEEANRPNEFGDIKEHMVTLYDLIIVHQPEIIIEAGIRTGRSSYAIRRAAEELRELYSYYAIDINPNCEKTLQPLDSREHFYCMDDVAFAEARLWKKNWPNENSDMVDFIFIDTSHTYEQTLKELRAFLPVLAPGGILVMHDTNCENTEYGDAIRQAINEVFGFLDINWSRLVIGKKIPGFFVTHYPNCNGLTVFEKDEL